MAALSLAALAVVAAALISLAIRSFHRSVVS
jgi:hypothetical protein